MSVAFSVCQVNSVDWPCWIEVGLAVKVAVGSTGAGTGGGGGGGAVCVTFLWQPAKNNTVASVSSETAPELMCLIYVLLVVLDRTRAYRGNSPATAPAEWHNAPLSRIQRICRNQVTRNMNCRSPNVASTPTMDDKYVFYICGRLTRKMGRGLRSSSRGQ